MTEEEELLFGLKRWIKKGMMYINDIPTLDDFLKNDLVFDACSFVIYTVSEIATRISELDSMQDLYSEVKEIKHLKNLKAKLFQADNIDCGTMFEELKFKFVNYLMRLEII